MFGDCLYGEAANCWHGHTLASATPTLPSTKPNPKNRGGLSTPNVSMISSLHKHTGQTQGRSDDLKQTWQPNTTSTRLYPLQCVVQIHRLLQKSQSKLRVSLTWRVWQINGQHGQPRDRRMWRSTHDPSQQQAASVIIIKHTEHIKTATHTIILFVSWAVSRNAFKWFGTLMAMFLILFRPTFGCWKILT